MAAPFPQEAVADLRAFLDTVRVPLAVRSSGLLEDSINQPFSGVYQTFMLPNNHAEDEMRLIQLIAAIKRVFASTFSMQAKAVRIGFVLDRAGFSGGFGAVNETIEALLALLSAEYPS